MTSHETPTMTDSLLARSYAKVNLYLDVLPRRDDGFHDIETIFQTVDLFDEVRLAKHDDSILISCNHDDLATEDNLAWRAADALRKRTGYNGGVQMHVEKRIPVAAGLAGGSGNAAAALMGLNRLWDLGLSDGDLAAIALDLGSDVPYCLFGGTHAATGRGEVLERIAPMGDLWLCLVHPNIGISTAAMYGSPALKKNDSELTDGKTAAFREALANWEKGDYDAVMFNAMQPPAIADHPVLAEYIQTLEANGCSCAMMSGSGPTVFGIATTKVEAERAASAVGDARVTIARPVDRGVTLELNGTTS